MCEELFVNTVCIGFFWYEWNAPDWIPLHPSPGDDIIVMQKMILVKWMRE